MGVCVEMPRCCSSECLEVAVAMNASSKMAGFYYLLPRQHSFSLLGAMLVIFLKCNCQVCCSLSQKACRDTLRREGFSNQHLQRGAEDKEGGHFFFLKMHKQL